VSFPPLRPHVDTGHFLRRHVEQLVAPLRAGRRDGS